MKIPPQKKENAASATKIKRNTEKSKNIWSKIWYQQSLKLSKHIIPMSRMPKGIEKT